MKIVEVRSPNIHTSLGKLFKGDRAELPDKEVETFHRVRPNCLFVVGDVQTVKEPAPAPVTIKKAPTPPKMTLKAKGEKVSKK